MTVELSAESGFLRGVGPTWASSIPASTRAEPRTPDCELGDPSDSQGSRSGPPSTAPEALEVAPPPSAGTRSPGRLGVRLLPEQTGCDAQTAWGSARRCVHPARPTHGTGRSCGPRSGESSPAGASGRRGAPAPGPRPRPVPSGLTRRRKGRRGLRLGLNLAAAFPARSPPTETPPRQLSSAETDEAF